MSDTPETRVPCPYAVGAIFSLEVSSPQGSPFVAEARVVELYSPFSASSVMKVTLTSQSTKQMIPGEAVLKVHDRRFADGIRSEHNIMPPTYEAEARYAEYLRSGDVLQTLDQIYDAVEEFSEGHHDPLELAEHLAAVRIKPFIENEKTTYSVLSSLQGDCIPTFYGTTRFMDTSLPGIDTTVPGILIEFIPGTNLSQIDPSTIDLNAVILTAMDIVNAYSDLNILNSDVRLANFIVKPSGSEVVMIDFGDCRLRGEDEDDQAWKEAKCEEGEEVSIGFAARRWFGWNYVASGRYFYVEP
ncbi:hypothetical protein RSOL_389720 [Rhizoctonia solani AG-3 Rhs1AP]|uniref:Kinase domain protein n=1 Tax=Rhizoctonia solani AG-3 Rhs1AP TaxID=1086054 RepID=X8JCA5_9AGAM|nr:hypothetical protein RSOL_389720 [Rhizoctonia solani AG-3 Rhs1AP]